MDMILKNTFQSISPAYELIGDVTVGSNTTQVDFTGLNIGKDDELLLVSDIKNATTTSNISLQLIANNVSATSHYVQGLYAGNTTVVGVRENNPKTGALYNASNTLILSSIKLTNSGYYVHQSHEYYGHTSPTNAYLENWYCSSTVTLTSITSLKITASTASSIGIGSRFQLYKLVAEKVADIIVPSNTTSVDITGLNIGKDGEYYLVSDVVNGTSSNMGIAMFVNTNNTLTNYYIQRLWAEGSSVGGSRGNNSYFSIVSGTNGQKNTFTSANLKLANSGYFVLQSKGLRGYGGVLPQIENYSATTTFTASEITSIRLQSDITNAIGANSRFTLYKMK